MNKDANSFHYLTSFLVSHKCKNSKQGGVVGFSISPIMIFVIRSSPPDGTRETMLSLIYCCYLHTYILGGQELGLSQKSLVVMKCEACKVYTALASTYIYDAQDVQMCYFFV